MDAWRLSRAEHFDRERWSGRVVVLDNAPVSIKGHVNYGSASASVAKQSAPAAPVPVHSVTRPPRRPRIRLNQEAIFDFVLEIAKCGKRCPTGDALTQKFGKQANRALIGMARAGRLTIEVGGHNWRVVTIGGFKTEAFPKGGKPYRRIDANDDQWCRDGVWERARVVGAGE